MYDYRQLSEAMERLRAMGRIGELDRLSAILRNPLTDPNLTRSLAADLSATVDRMASVAATEWTAASAAATASIAADASATAASLREKLDAILPDYHTVSEAVREHARILDTQRQMLGTALLPDHFGASEAVLERIRALEEPALAVSSRLQDIYAEQHAVADALRDQYLALDRYIEHSLPALDWKRLTAAIGPIDAVRQATADLAAAYAEIDARLAAEWSSNFAFGVEGLPGIEMYAHLNLLRGLASGAGSASPDVDTEDEEAQTQEQIAEESHAGLHGLLAANRPELLEPWLGAKEGLSARHDAVRKYCACQRQVLLELLTLAAPTPRVRAWSSNPEHFRDRNPKNEPTWTARILYLCERASRADYGHFVLTDVRAARSVYDRLNRGVHATSAGFTRRQILDLQIRSDNLILLALRISIEAN